MEIKGNLKYFIPGDIPFHSGEIKRGQFSGSLNAIFDVILLYIKRNPTYYITVDFPFYCGEIKQMQVNGTLDTYKV